MDANSRPIQLVSRVPVIDLDVLRKVLSKDAEEVEEVKKVEVREAGLGNLLSKMDFGQAIEVFDGEKSVFRGRAMDLVTIEEKAKQKPLKHMTVRAGRILIWV